MPRRLWGAWNWARAVGAVALMVTVVTGAHAQPHATTGGTAEAVESGAPGIGKLTAEQREQLARARLLVTFQGKGSSLPYDAGVIDEAFRWLPVLAQNEVVLAGNSSGSILATYYSCFGFSQVSVEYASYRLPRADVSAVRANESGGTKAVGLLRGKPTEISHDALREYVAFALGVRDWQSARTIFDVARRSTVRPKHPLVIVAANAEVLENRGPRAALQGTELKVFDPDTFDVSWRPEVYDFYRRHPERFAAEHPKLRLGPTPRIGKACTYFVDATMFAALSLVPPEERLGDLRLLSDATDLALAIQASVSEPSYFDAAVETRPERLAVGGQLGDLGNSRQRSYCGGFVMPLVAQDVRRVLPAVRVLGTGCNRVPWSARVFVADWFLVDIEPVAERNRWWVDLEVHNDPVDEQRIIDRALAGPEEFALGRRVARTRLSADRGLPDFVIPPRLGSPVPGAIVAADRAIDMAPAADGESPRLLTLRGLGPLLQRPASE